MELVLASKSKRRRKLFSRVCRKFRAEPSNVMESSILHSKPDELAKKRAAAKAAKVALRHPNSIVIGADTIIVFGKSIIGKPKGAKDARGMISSFSGKKVKAVTGVAVVCEGLDYAAVWSEQAMVKFHTISGRKIENYIRSGKWKGKAGGFNIEEMPVKKWVKAVGGERETAIGLPLKRLHAVLSGKKW